MSQVETNLIITLQQVARGLAAVGQNVQRSRWEIWGPPLASMAITVLGWLWLVLANAANNRHLVKLQTEENARNNRDALRLQAEELARNRILDALDEYHQYLFDVDDMRRILFQNGGVRSKEPMGASDDGVPQSDLVVDIRILEQTITRLSILDGRQYHWIDSLERDSWVFDPKSDMSQRAMTCLARHKGIMDSFFVYAEQLRTGVQEGNAYLARRLGAGRDAAARRQIAEQRTETLVIYAQLSRPRFLPPESR